MGVDETRQESAILETKGASNPICMIKTHYSAFPVANNCDVTFKTAAFVNQVWQPYGIPRVVQV
jgi:hypothetical protein